MNRDGGTYDLSDNRDCLLVTDSLSRYHQLPMKFAEYETITITDHVHDIICGVVD